MAKRRSREFKDHAVIDMDKARLERREKRNLANARRVKTTNKAEATVSARQTAKRNRRRLVYLVVIVAIALLIGTAIYNVIILKAEEAKALSELKALEETKARLQQELLQVDSSEYIEQEARQQLKMIFPGETLYVLKNSEAEEDQ